MPANFVDLAGGIDLPSVIDGGQTVPVQVSVRNNGLSTSSGGYAFVDLPAGSGLDPTHLSQNLVWQSGDDLLLRLPNLRPGATYKDTIWMTAPLGGVRDQVVSATVNVLTNGYDWNPWNNIRTDRALLHAARGDLSLSFAGPASVEVDSTATYNIQVRNVGFQTVQQPVVSVPIPSGFTLDRSSSTRGWYQTGQTAILKLSNLRPGATFNGTIAFRTAGASEGFYAVSASVTSRTQEATYVNNFDYVVTNVTAPAIGTLSVAVQSIGTQDVLVSDQKNVDFLRFHLGAQTKDVLFTSVSATLQQGRMTDVTNWALWVDTDGNGGVDTKVAKATPVNGLLTFDAIMGGGYVIPVDGDVVMEIHGDIVPSPSGAPLQLSFATQTQGFVQAEDLQSGQSLGSGNITVTTTDSIVYSVEPQGNLYVVEDSSPVSSRQLLEGELGDPILRLRFRAENEGIEVTTLQFEAVGWPIQSLDSLALYLEGEAAPFAFATIAGAGGSQVNPGTFVANMQSQQLVILKGQERVVLVRPFIKTDVSGAIPGEMMQFRVNPTAVSNNATGQGAVRARGLVSHRDLDATDGNLIARGEVFIGTNSAGVNMEILSRVNDVVGIKLEDLENGNPDANGTIVPTGVTPFGQFTFGAHTTTASQGGLDKMVLDGLVLTVDAANVAIDASTLRLYNKADLSVQVIGTAYDLAGNVLTGTITGQFYVLFQSLGATGVNTTLGSSETMTLVLQAKILNPQVNPALSSTLVASLDHFSDSALQSFGILDSHILWHNKDAFHDVLFTWFEFPETVVRSTMYQS